MNLVVLASGRGTNFSAIAGAVLQNQIPHAHLLALVCNKPAAPVVAIAQSRGIPVHVVGSDSFRKDGKLDRPAYETELGKVLEKLNPDYICLAGYMLILGEAFVKRWAGKLINIHPSLLPRFPGLHPHRQALAAGAVKTGCTVHLVTEKVDDGPILAQGELAILPDDTEVTLAERLLPVEHETYIRALQALAEKHIKQRS